MQQLLSTYYGKTLSDSNTSSLVGHKSSWKGQGSAWISSSGAFSRGVSASSEVVRVEGSILAFLPPRVLHIVVVVVVVVVVVEEVVERNSSKSPWNSTRH